VCDYRTAVCINIDTLCTMCIQAVLPCGPQCTGAGDESLINNNGFVLASAGFTLKPQATAALH